MIDDEGPWKPKANNWKPVYALEDSKLFHILSYKEYKVYRMIQHHAYRPKKNKAPQLNPFGSCWLSQDQLSSSCDMSERSVRDAIRGLEKKKLLRVHRTPGRNQYHQYDCTCTRCDRQRLKSNESPKQRAIKICVICNKVIQDKTQTHVNIEPGDICQCSL